MLMSDGLVGAVGLNTVGPTSRPVKRLGFVISDGRRQPSEITYVRRQPSDIALFPTSYLRRLKAVGDKALPSEIIYFRRFIPYVRWLWPSDVSAFTVVRVSIYDYESKYCIHAYERSGTLHVRRRYCNLRS
jgi:hypothetical protein